jgi:SNW domain-containing protein 1
MTKSRMNRSRSRSDSSSSSTSDKFDARNERDAIRAQRRREIIREDRLERLKKSKNERDNERDISEKIALGQAQPTSRGEALFDQRLFNQTAGLGSGFGHEEDYNLYDKPLFTDRTAASIYKGIKTLDNAETGDDDQTGQRVRKVLGN